MDQPKYQRQARRPQVPDVVFPVEIDESLEIEGKALYIRKSKGTEGFRIHANEMGSSDGNTLFEPPPLPGHP